MTHIVRPMIEKINQNKFLNRRVLLFMHSLVIPVIYGDIFFSMSFTDFWLVLMILMILVALGFSVLVLGSSGAQLILIVTPKTGFNPLS